MHHKKIPRVNFGRILHSIPILGKNKYPGFSLNKRSVLHKNNHLRYLSSGIPLASIAALLFLVGISIVCPSLDIPFFSGLSSDAYAEEVDDNSNDENYDIDLLANAPNAEATLTIGGEAINATTNVGLGSVGYRKHTVKIKTTDVTNYTLSITGPTNLTGNTTVTGAGNKTSANMANNTWGYYYGDSSNESSVTYKSFTGGAQNLETNNTGVNNPGTTAKNLIFAAKFADTATTGHYTASVVLSLVATPKQINTYTLSYNTNGGSTAPASTTCTTAAGVPNCNVTVTSTTPTKTNNEFLGWSTSSTATEADANYAAGKTVSISADTPLYAVWKVLVSDDFNGITKMQDMTSSVCSGAASKASGRLYDTRDNSSYTVTKLDDGKCWMTTNLRLVNKTITSSDSDVTSSYTVPANESPWETPSAPTQTQVNIQAVHYADNAINGAYYSWCAATANSCTSATTLGSVAARSICPKGWRLPTIEEYSTFLSSAGIANSSDGSIKIRGTPYNFPYAGTVSNSTLKDVDSAGRYWSSTVSDSSFNVSTSVQGLTFDDSSVRTSLTSGRYVGRSVRCIAK